MSENTRSLKHSSPFYGVVAVLFSTAIMIAVAFPQIVSAGDSHPPTPKTLVLQGKGSVSVEPDEIRFVIGVDARAPTASKAYQEVESKMKQVMSVLKRLDIPERDIQAMNLSLQPVIDYKNQQRITGHDVRRDIAVKLVDIESYGRVMQSLGELDIMRFQNVQMTSSKQKTLSVEALERAYLDAEAKAKRLAKMSGRTLKGLLHLVEGGVSSQPKYMAARMEMAADSSATTSKGSIAVEASVTATFEIE